MNECVSAYAQNFLSEHGGMCCSVLTKITYQNMDECVFQRTHNFFYQNMEACMFQSTHKNIFSGHEWMNECVAAYSQKLFIRAWMNVLQRTHKINLSEHGGMSVSANSQKYFIRTWMNEWINEWMNVFQRTHKNNLSGHECICCSVLTKITYQNMNECVFQRTHKNNLSEHEWMYVSAHSQK